MIGDVAGKTAIIVDDMIDTAGTLRAAGEAVMAAGAREVCAVATHGIFSADAYATLAASPFDRIVVTDTVPLRPGAPDCIEVVSCAGLLADTVRPHLHRGLGQRGLRRTEPGLLGPPGAGNERERWRSRSDTRHRRSSSARAS